MSGRRALRVRASCMLTALTATAILSLSPPVEAATPKKKRANPNAALFMEARSAVQAKLRDPGSARFRNLRVVTTAVGSKKICGEVNAKNGFGGYTGFTRFAYLGIVAFEPQSKDQLDLYSTLGRDCD